MPAFHQIAVPHADILSENFSSEVYAAKLWDVFSNRGSDEYTDAEIFFEKTYLTGNMQKILNSVKKRLDGKGGSHFRSITTPFGGGKTHTLIALYHRCNEWGYKPVVLVGNELDVQSQTLWGTIEKQLTGKIERLGGQTPRGSSALRTVLKEQNRPILILIDELLQYITKAAGIKINDTTLAMQTIAFIQELSEAVGSLPNVCVVVTLPSSKNEQNDDERFERLNEMLRKVAGRVRDTISPVSDIDIPSIIRRRLFSSTDAEIRDRAESIVKDFVAYCEEERLIPDGMQPSEYRDEFLASYPFLPQVINVLYQRWGTMPLFQRTRGVLRLLSLVVGSLASSNKQFITLSDFDLSNNVIKQELIEYLDDQFNGVVAKDIVGKGSGARKVDHKIPAQYWGKQLGTRAATAMFMYSHSGGEAIRNGATAREIKRATCERNIPAAQISEVLNLFQNNLFYLSVINGRYMFTKETNMHKRKVDVMNNLKLKDIEEATRDLLRKNIGRTGKIFTTLWPTKPSDVEDTKRIKLAIMKENDFDLIKLVHDTYGESVRIYRNNIFFLAPADSERARFINALKSKMALERIKNDPQTNLKDEPKKTLENELSKENARLKRLIKEYYGVLYIPEKNGLDHIRMRPPIATDSRIDHVVYEQLVDDETVSSKIGPLSLKKGYLSDKKVVETSDLLKSMLSVPGERRPASRDVLADAIMDGVYTGEFGLGEVENDTPVVRFFKEQTEVNFEHGEVLIHASLCIDNYEKQVDVKTGTEGGHEVSPNPPSSQSHTTKYPSNDFNQLVFEFNVPEGQVNHISQMLLTIASHYNDLRLQVSASNGSMSEHNVKMIKETLKQMGSEFDGLS